MIEIYCLGTNGAVSAPGRDHTSWLMRAEDGLLLVDCSGSLFQKIRRLGFHPREVRRVFLTHVHPDHIFALPSLVHGLMLEKGEIKLFGSAETTAFARSLLDLFGLRRRSFRTRVVFRPLRAGKVVWAGGGLYVRALKTPHHASSLAYEFSLTDGRKKILFSGDTPPHPPLFEAARGADYLIHEASAPYRFFRKYPVLSSFHTSARELGRWSEKVGVRCLIPCHFLGELPFSPSEIRAEIRREYHGRLIMPREMMKIPVGSGVGRRAGRLGTDACRGARG